MKAIGEKNDSGLFFVTEGAIPVFNDWHKGEIIVERHGMLHPKYVFLHNNEEIAVLNWRRARSGIYEAKNLRLELQVGTLGKTIRAKDDFSHISTLTVKSPLNPRKAKMFIQLADSDGFIVHQYCDDISSNNFSLHVTKKHYVAYLIKFEFSLKKKRSRTIARIYVPPIMRWEAHHFHQLLALVMGHIAFTQNHNLYRDQQFNPLRKPASVGRRRWELTRNIASGRGMVLNK